MFEVIIVDNGSTDSTKQIFESYRNRITNLRYCFDDTPGLHVGRHRGMQEAESETLVYADDDIEAFPTWLEAIAKDFKNNEAVLVGGKNLPQFEVPPPEWILTMWRKNSSGHRILSYLSILDLGDEVRKVDPSHVYGCNLSILKSALLDEGGFHPDSMPDDYINYRGDGESHVVGALKAKGHNALYDPKASVYHIVTRERMTERYFCNRAYRQGISDSYTSIREKGLADTRPLFGRCLMDYLHSVMQPYPQRRICVAYWKGFFSHQRAVKRNQALYQWVTKDRYF